MRPVVERLGQLERHDLSSLVGEVPGPDGLFEFPRLSRFFGDAGHEAHLIYADATLAGFCLTRPFEDGSRFIHSFFVVRALRRHGVGLAAARQLLQSHAGRWTIAFLEENASAARFWRAVAAAIVGQDWVDERRQGADRSDAFTFLHLRVDQDTRVLP